MLGYVCALPCCVCDAADGSSLMSEATSDIKERLFFIQFAPTDFIGAVRRHSAPSVQKSLHVVIYLSSNVDPR